MKFPLLFSFLFFSLCLGAQTVNDVPVRDIDSQYLQIVGTGKMLSTKVTIKLDFGQDTKLFSASSQMVVKDEKGKLKKFNSMIDALNFFSKNGYEFVQAYVITQNNQNVYHYLMRKQK